MVPLHLFVMFLDQQIQKGFLLFGGLKLSLLNLELNKRALLGFRYRDCILTLIRNLDILLGISLIRWDLICGIRIFIILIWAHFFNLIKIIQNLNSNSQYLNCANQFDL